MKTCSTLKPALFATLMLLASATANAGDAGWFYTAGAPENAAQILAPASSALADYGGLPALDLPEDQNLYEAQSYQISLPAEAFVPGKTMTLEIAFFDQGAGVIRPSLAANGAAAAMGSQISYTRLNTQRGRSAYFDFTPPDVWQPGVRPVLSVVGLQHLTGVKVHEAFSKEQWAEIRKNLPKDVQPMVSLQRPMDLVTTAGVSVFSKPELLHEDLALLDEYAPLAKALGFNGLELYVRWSYIEPTREGDFDFTYYDALVAKMGEYGMKWFPLLVVGSEYALPKWFIESKENIGFRCLEHGKENLIQSIWSPFHQRHVSRVLQAFGKHYDRSGTLLGVRLGPSGNFGESQYPAGGNWPAEGRQMHIHIGLWSGDAYALQDFQTQMAARYGTIDALNQAWDAKYKGFSDIQMQLPETIESKRHRIDYSQWYTRCMSDWCGWWAQEAAKAMPNTKIYQSAGGWGFLEAGTSYTEQAEAMAPFKGGIRCTNETDSFEQNIEVTRLAATAARCYGIDLGYEPASSHTARGAAGRIFNTATTNGNHLFTYQGNVQTQPMAIDRWVQYLPVLDKRQNPVIDVAVYYPETMNQLEDAAFRHLYATGFYPRAAEVRRVVDTDYLDEKLIRDGFLDRYKVLVFAWGEFVEADVLARIDDWVRRGGMVIYPSFPRGPLMTIEGDAQVFNRWSSGGTEKGRFLRFKGDMEPTSYYGQFIAEQLRKHTGLHPWTRAALAIDKPQYVFLSVLEDGTTLALNYSNQTQTLKTPAGDCTVPAWGIGQFVLSR